jgi:hypothetical protein
VFEWTPIGRDGIKIRRVRRQEFLRTACSRNEAARFGRLMEASVIVHRHLSGLEQWDSALLHVRPKECGSAGPCADEWGKELRPGERGEHDSRAACAAQVSRPSTARPVDSGRTPGLRGYPSPSPPDTRAALGHSPPPPGETAPAALRHARHTRSSFFMRVAQLLQLSPERHPAAASPGGSPLFYGRVPLVGNPGLGLLESRNLMRMPRWVAGLSSHLARGAFPRHPCETRIAMHPKRRTCFFHPAASVDCSHHATP